MVSQKKATVNTACWEWNGLWKIAVNFLQGIEKAASFEISASNYHCWIIFPYIYILGTRIPFDFHIFQRGRLKPPSRLSFCRNFDVMALHPFSPPLSHCPILYLVGGFKHFFIFHNIWDNHSHWLSYFSIWLKPPTIYIYILPSGYD